MSNPSDPNTPSTPELPDPKKPAEKKGDETAREHSGGSTFEFQLPDGANTYGDMPPVPQPDGMDATMTHKTALPPRPESTRPATNTFDFIDLPDVDLASLSGSGLQKAVPPGPPKPVEPVAKLPGLISTDDVIILPPPVPTAPAAGDSSVTFEQPVPTTDPSSFTLSGEVVDLANMPEIPTADSSLSRTSIPDIATLFPTAVPGSPGSDVFGSAAQPEVPVADPGSFVFGGDAAIADFELPTADPASAVLSGVGLDKAQPAPTADPGSFVMGGAVTMPTAAPADPASAMLAEVVPDVPVADSGSFVMADPLPEVPVVDSGSFVMADPLPVVPVADSGSFVMGGPQAVADLGLPPIGSSTVLGDVIPIVSPTDSDSAILAEVVPDEPTAESGSLGSFVMADPLPPAPVPADDPEAVLGNLEPVDLVDPVAPASGWLDSDVLSIPSADPTALVPTAEPTPGPLDHIPTAPVESSDIFSGARAELALPVEQSDVIVATAYGHIPPADVVPPAEPAEPPPHPSEVALTFDGPPGGSTLHSDSGDMPIADEVLGSSALLGVPKGDDESIHDMPDPASADPLFDSAKLVNAPELPEAPVHSDDATDYGTVPTYSADASSILADVDAPHDPSSADSSSVRVEAPGVDRTIAGSADDAFDLTVSDEPMPAGLFDEPSGPAADATDWQSQSGSDLFAEGRTAPEIDLDAEAADSGRVEPVDADLTGEQPSLSSAPSSIFSGDQPSALGSGSVGSASVRIGSPEPPSEAVEAEPIEAEIEADLADPEVDAAEFSANPVLNDTSERDTLAPPTVPPKKAAHGLSSADFEVPASFELVPAPADADVDDGGAGAIDWDAAALADGDEATRGIPKDASLSAIIRDELVLKDDSTEHPTKNARPLAETEEPAAVIEDTEGPVVTVDWMAGSSEGSAVIESETTDPEFDEKIQKRRKEKEDAKAKDKGKGKDKPKGRLADTGTEEVAPPVEKKTRPARAPDDSAERGPSERASEKEKRKPSKKGSGMVIGLLVGAVVAGGAWAALYFGNVIPNAEQKALNQTGKPGGDNPGSQQPGTQQPPVATDPQAVFASGDTTKALSMLKTTAPTTTADRAAAGHVRVFSKVQGAGTEEDLKQGREDLKAVMTNTEDAKTADGLKRAVQAAVTLGASYEAAGDIDGARKVFTDAKAQFPSQAPVFDALLDKLDAAAPGASFRRITPADLERALLAVSVLLADDAPKADPEEPGIYYWKAVKLGAEGKYTEAIDLIGKAKAAHVKRAKALAGRGINPLTDPLEQMFPRACDEMAAAWKLRAELYGNSKIAELVKKDGWAKTLDALAKAQSDLTKAQVELTTAKAELKTAKEDFTTAKADLKTATDKATKLEKDVDKLDKDYKAAEKARTESEDKLKTATTALETAEKSVKDKDALLESVVKELKPAVPLPDKWGPADLVAAVKTTVARSSVGLGQFIEVAMRSDKAEAAAKLATEKLTAETKRREADVKVLNEKYDTDTKKLNDKYTTDTTKLKTDHAAELKKLTDGYAADAKKLKEEHTTAITKAKDDSAAELKKVTDKAITDAKKLTDDHLAALKKLNEDHDTAIKAEQAKTEAEKKAAAMKEIGFQKQLANAVTPAQAMDLWLPVLTDLRRAADAETALGIAKRALASALPGSEDEAKAHTVTGMSLLLKGDLAGAKDEFTIAKRSPAYKAEKAWARVADTGLDAVDDPLAPYRQPVVIPPVDLKAAAKALDTGISAYKAGKYDAAETAFTSATKNDPADPVAWYYLGAVRWAQGKEEQAKKDFGQGAEREKVSPMSARVLADALAPIQGAARDAMDKARP